MPAAFQVERQSRLLLYLLVRAARPQQGVETGVADGRSSVVLLRALAANGPGALRSVGKFIGVTRLR